MVKKLLLVYFWKLFGYIYLLNFAEKIPKEIFENRIKIKCQQNINL